MGGIDNRDMSETNIEKGGYRKHARTNRQTNSKNTNPEGKTQPTPHQGVFQLQKADLQPNPGDTKFGV